MDRGGRGAYLGGLREFQHYASHHYDITPSTDEGVERKVRRGGREGGGGKGEGACGGWREGR